MITSEEASKLISLVRKIFSTLEKGKEPLDNIKAPKSVSNSELGVYLVFIKVDSPSKEELLILGYPVTQKRLDEAIRELAYNAYIRLRERSQIILSKVLIELHILSPLKSMEDVKPVKYPKHIIIGKHGVMVERNFYTALILPYIATKRGWDPIDILSECCVAAGLPPDAWLDSETKVYLFEDEVFRELKPQGKVVRITKFREGEI